MVMILITFSTHNKTPFSQAPQTARVDRVRSADCPQILVPGGKFDVFRGSVVVLWSIWIWRGMFHHLWQGCGVIATNIYRCHRIGATNHMHENLTVIYLYWNILVNRVSSVPPAIGMCSLYSPVAGSGLLFSIHICLLSLSSCVLSKCTYSPK